jgi:hypothetical protein
MTERLPGGCLCGAIRYEIAQAVENVIACHCTDCQKAVGGGASHNSVVRTENVTYTAGTPKAYTKEVSPGKTLIRYFCGECGSPVFTQREYLPEFMVLKVGTLDDPSSLKMTMNIWTRSARPWMPIDETLENYETNRPL